MQDQPKFKASTRLSVAAAALTIASVAFESDFALAQGDQAQAPGQSRGVLDTIVVKTKGGERNVQTYAAPVTVIQGDQFDRTYAQDLRDLTHLSPNVMLEGMSIFQNHASFFIRGLGVEDSESAVDPVVAVVVNGVYQARSSTALSDLLDVNNVQVLRGPQGTEFGHNSTVGAVVIENNRPDLEDFGASGGITVGQFGRLDLKGVVNVPFANSKAAGRIAFKSTNFDGFYRNDFTGERAGGNDRITILPSFRLQPNDNLDILIRGEYSRTRDDTYLAQSHNYCRDDLATALAQGTIGAATDLILLTEYLYALIVEGKDDPTATAQAESLCGKPAKSVSAKEEFTTVNTGERGDFANFDVWGITAEVNYDIPDVGTFTYIGNYRDVEESVRFFVETSTHDDLAGRRDQTHYQTTHELRFASDLSEEFDFVVGLYYFEQEYTLLQESWGVFLEPNVLLGDPGAPFYNAETSSQAGWSNYKDEAWAAFVNANWHVTDRLTFTAGVRYTDQKKDFEHCAVGTGDPTVPFNSSAIGCNNVPYNLVDPMGAPFTGPSGLTPILPVMQAYGFDASGGVEGACEPVVTGDPADGLLFCNNRLSPEPASWNNFSPTVKVSFELNEDIFLFALWSRGFRSGSFNAQAGSPSTIGPYDPERADNYEVGIKSEFFERRLQVNFNAFWLVINDRQQGFIRPSPDGNVETVVSNIGEVRNRGIELEVSAIPTDGLTLFGALGFIDHHQKGFCADTDGPEGTDPLNPPAPPAGLTGCADPEAIIDAVGGFSGWLVPTDNSNLFPLPKTPKWNLSAGFAYEWMVGNAGSVTLAMDWAYNSRQLAALPAPGELDGVTQFNGDFLDHYRKPTNIINGSVTWRDLEDRYRLSFFVKNLTNEVYKQAVLNVVPLFQARVPGHRRHWGIEIEFSL